MSFSVARSRRQLCFGLPGPGPFSCSSFSCLAYVANHGFHTELVCVVRRSAKKRSVEDIQDGLAVWAGSTLHVLQAIEVNCHQDELMVTLEIRPGRDTAISADGRSGYQAGEREEVDCDNVWKGCCMTIQSWMPVGKAPFLLVHWHAMLGEVAWHGRQGRGFPGWLTQSGARIERAWPTTGQGGDPLLRQPVAPAAPLNF